MVDITSRPSPAKIEPGIRRGCLKKRRRKNRAMPLPRIHPATTSLGVCAPSATRQNPISAPSASPVTAPIRYHFTFLLPASKPNATPHTDDVSMVWPLIIRKSMERTSIPQPRSEEHTSELQSHHDLV